MRPMCGINFRPGGVHTWDAFFLRKSKIGFLNAKESENGFCLSLLNRSIQDLLDHGMSKHHEPRNPFCKVVSSGPLTHHDQRDLGLICLVKKRKIHFLSLWDLRIQYGIFLKKRTLRL